MPSASKRWKSSTSLAGMSAQRPLGPAEIGEDAVIEAAFDGNIAQRRAARRDIAPLALGRDHRGRDALRLRRHQLPLRHLDVATGKCALHILAAAVEQAWWAQLAAAAGEAEGEQQGEGGEGGAAARHGPNLARAAGEFKPHPASLPGRAGLQ